RTSSHPRTSPMGRLPTSPRNSFATGRLKKLKPIIAPQVARLTTTASGGSMPNKPITAIAAVTGTTCATVSQSRPSLKLTKIAHPHAANEDRRPQDPGRYQRPHPKTEGKLIDNYGHREYLQQQPRRNSDRTDVGKSADARQKNGRGKQCRQL